MKKQIFVNCMKEIRNVQEKQDDLAAALNIDSVEIADFLIDYIAEFFEDIFDDEDGLLENYIWIWRDEGESLDELWDNLNNKEEVQ